MLKFYVLVEGHGEVGAVQNLVVRVSRVSNNCGYFYPWSNPLRWPNLHQWESRSGRGGILKGINFIRSKQDVGGLLILRDEDDACPRDMAPEMAARLRELKLPFPVAYVLLHPEYEVLFLPCLEQMTGEFPDGRPGLENGTVWDGATWEARRGIKEWLSKHFPPGRIYKPTMDQYIMTRKIDLEVLRNSDVPCFGSLERAIQMLCEHIGSAGFVYPCRATNR